MSTMLLLQLQMQMQMRVHMLKIETRNWYYSYNYGVLNTQIHAYMYVVMIAMDLVDQGLCLLTLLI
jgi:hypothetical protein